MRTLHEVFGEQNVQLISISNEFDKIGISTFIVLAGRDYLNIKDFMAFIKNRSQGEITSALVPEPLLRDFIKETLQSS